jgi:hypothetical protein
MGKYEVTDGMYHHHVDDCDPTTGCPFHGHSDHHMVGWPMDLTSYGLVQRICQHGVRHPDPDAVAFYSAKIGGAPWDIHTCDGCCNPNLLVLIQPVDDG